MKIKSTAMAICFILLSSLSFAHTLEVDLIADTDRTWGWVENEQTNIYELIQINHYHELHKVGDVIPTLNGTTAKYELWLDGAALDRSKFSTLYKEWGTRFNSTGSANNHQFNVPDLSKQYLVGYQFGNSQKPFSGHFVDTLDRATLFVPAEVPNITGWVSAGLVRTWGDDADKERWLRAFGTADGAFRLKDYDEYGASARWSSGLLSEGYRTFNFDASRISSFYKTDGKPTVPAARVMYKTWYEFPPPTEHIKIKDITRNTNISNGRLEIVSGCKYPGLIDWVSPRSTQGVTSRAIHQFITSNFSSNRLTIAAFNQSEFMKMEVQTDSDLPYTEDDSTKERTAATEEWVKLNFIRKPATYIVDKYVAPNSTNAVSSQGVYKFVADCLTNVNFNVFGGGAGSEIDTYQRAEIDNKLNGKADKTAVADAFNDMTNYVDSVIGEFTPGGGGGGDANLSDYMTGNEITNFVEEAVFSAINELNFPTVTNSIMSAIYLYDAYDEFDMQVGKPKVFKLFVYKGTLCVKEINQEERGRLTGKYE